MEERNEGKAKIAVDVPISVKNKFLEMVYLDKKSVNPSSSQVSLLVQLVNQEYKRRGLENLDKLKTE